MRHANLALSAAALLLIPCANTSAQPLTVDGPALFAGAYPLATDGTFTCVLAAGQRYRVVLEPGIWERLDIELVGPGGAAATHFTWPYLGDVFSFPGNVAFTCTPALSGQHTISIRQTSLYGPPLIGSFSYVVSIFNEGPSSDNIPNGVSTSSWLPADGRSVSSVIDYQQDRDVFLLEVEPGRIYRLRASVPNADVGIIARVISDHLPGDQQLMLFADSSIGRSQSSLLFRTRVEPTNYALQATGGDQALYTLAVEPLEPDIAVAAPNTAATAIGAAPNEPFPLVVADPDGASVFIRVHLEGATAYDLVSVAGDGDYSARLALLSSDGTRLMAFADQASKIPAPSFIVPQTGDYLFKLKLEYGGARFRLVSRGDAPLVPLATPATAAVLTPDSPALTLGISDLPPIAYYELEMAPGAVYQLDLATSGPCSAPGIPFDRYTADIYSGNSTVAFANLSFSEPSQPPARTVVIANPLGRPQSVSLGVRRAEYLNSCSQATLSVRCTMLAVPDQTHGFSPENPLLLTPDGTSQWLLRSYPGPLGPRWLSLPVVAGHRYTVRTVTPVQQYLAQLITILDSDGHAIADRYDSAAFISPSSGFALVRLDVGAERIEPSQRFVVAIAATDDGPASDDFPSTPADAAALTPGAWLDGVLEAPGDADDFAVTLRPGTRALVTLECGEPGRNVLVGMSPEGGPFARDGWLLGSAAVTGQLPTASVQLVSALGGRYTIRVTPFVVDNRLPPNPAPIPYRLRIDADGCFADIASIGGDLHPDGQLTADDVIAFLSAFLAGDLFHADLGSVGGAFMPDGYLTPDDLIAFFTGFFDCPRP